MKIKSLILGFLIIFLFISISLAGEKEELLFQRALLIEIIRRATFEAELAKRQLQDVETKIQSILQKEEKDKNKEIK